MLKLFVVAVTMAIVAADLDTDWFVFKAKNNKKYTPEVDVIRRNIWSENKKFIEEHNKKFSLGLSSYYMSENEFADMTSSEFASKVKGLKVERNYQDEKVPSTNLTYLPDTVDWRQEGYVTAVKNQGQCNSGWAFSATGSMEGQHFKATGNLVRLSESNLVDCSTPFGNRGCQGGLMENAFRYVIARKGIDTESGYPYKPENNPCEFQKSNVGATFTGYVGVTSGSELALQKAVAEVGPISVVIDSSHLSFQFYMGGVYDEPSCSSKLLDHGVLVVGYGKYYGKDYWLVKNSWGSAWGQGGYIMMSRNRNNQCGIATDATYPIV